MTNGKISPRRFGSVIGIKADMVARYRSLHAAVWPEVSAIIKDSQITNYSIYLRQFPDGQHYLFSYFEYTGSDFKRDLAQMAAHPVTQRWWRECVPCLELFPDRAPDEIWSPLTEVFHLD